MKSHRAAVLPILQYESAFRTAKARDIKRMQPAKVGYLRTVKG
jgi:hypothetical protein